MDCAEQVADLVGEVLGWSAETKAREVEVYRARVNAERESQSELNDEGADARPVRPAAGTP